MHIVIFVYIVGTITTSTVAGVDYSSNKEDEIIANKAFILSTKLKDQTQSDIFHTESKEDIKLLQDEVFAELIQQPELINQLEENLLEDEVFALLNKRTDLNQLVEHLENERTNTNQRTKCMTHSSLCEPQQCDVLQGKRPDKRSLEEMNCRSLYNVSAPEIYHLENPIAPKIARTYPTVPTDNAGLVHYASSHIRLQSTLSTVQVVPSSEKQNPVLTTLNSSTINNSLTDKFEYAFTEPQERCYQKWTEIVEKRNNLRLKTLLDNLTSSKQPLTSDTLCQSVRKHRRAKLLFDFPFEYLVNTKNVNIVLSRVDYEYDEGSTRPEACSICFFSDSSDQNVAIDAQHPEKYVNNIKSLCFDVCVESLKLIAKIELLLIIEYVPEFFHYLLYKIDKVEKAALTRDLALSLTAELATVKKLIYRFHYIVIDERKIMSDNDLSLINEFRDHVISYLTIYHQKSPERILYKLCHMSLYTNRLELADGYQYVCLSLCFAYDFTETFNILCRDVDEFIKNHDTGVSQSDVRVYINQKIIRNIKFNSPFYKFIDDHEQNTRDIFGAKNNNLLYFPNAFFTIVVVIDTGNNAMIYAIRKVDLGSMLQKEMIYLCKMKHKIPSDIARQ